MLDHIKKVPYTTSFLTLSFAVFLSAPIARAEFSSTPDSFTSYIDNNKVTNIIATDSAIYVAGEFGTVDDTPTGGGGYTPGTARGSLAAFDPEDGDLITSFVPETAAYSTINGMVLSPDGSTLYVGHTDFPDHNVLAISTATGEIDDTFTIVASAEVYGLALSSDGSVLYVSGRFTTIGGIARNRVAAINTSDGSIVSGFNPNAGGEVLTLLLSDDDSTLYLGGEFTTVGGTGRNRIAAVNTSDGSLVTAFNPGTSGVGGGSGQQGPRSFALDGTTLYVGGAFTNLAGTARNRIGAVSTVDGSIISGFNPNAGGGLVRNIRLHPDEPRLYLTGQFTTIGGQSRPGLASVSTSDGSASSFTQSAIDAGVGVAIAPDGSRIYAGNGFQSAYANSIFASYSATGVLVSDTTIAATEGGSSGTYEISLTAAPSDDVTITLTPDAQVSTSPTSLVFTSGDWDTPQTVTVSAVNDATVEGAHSGTLTHDASSSDTNYDGATIDDVTVTITDNDPTASPDSDDNSSESRTKGSVHYGCKDPLAANYDEFVASRPSLCIYAATGTAPVTPGTSESVFTRNLGLGMNGEEVRQLQKYLNANKFPVAVTGPGSTGNETTYFGPLTLAALSRFQFANGITPPVGYFGPITRAFILGQKK